MPNKILWQDVLDIIQSIEHAETFDEVFSYLKPFIQKAGGTSLLIGQVVNPVIKGKPIDSYGRSDWPEEYMVEWVENDYVIHDPITHLVLRASEPFDWSEAHEKGTKFGKEILDRAKEFGLEKGISIPIRTEYLPLGIVSIGYDEKISTEYLEYIEIVSIHAYTHAQSLKPNEPGFTPAALSKRETDVLTFTAAGKTTWEISVILGVAETTVRTHIRNIISKMGTSNKTQAVTKGIESGQIVL